MSRSKYCGKPAVLTSNDTFIKSHKRYFTSLSHEIKFLNSLRCEFSDV